MSGPSRCIFNGWKKSLNGHSKKFEGNQSERQAAGRVKAARKKVASFSLLIYSDSVETDI